jgi:hypothetical protein
MVWMASAKQGVRVSTVDNYKGEEARIVPALLVRSNDHHTEGDLHCMGCLARANRT